MYNFICTTRNSSLFLIGQVTPAQTHAIGWDSVAMQD